LNVNLPLDELDLFKWVLKWGNFQIDKHGRKSEEIYKQIMNHIRFPLMKPHELLQVVKPLVGSIVPEHLYCAACEYNASPESIDVGTLIQYKSRAMITNFTFDTTMNASEFAFSNNSFTVLKSGKSSWKNCFVFGNRHYKSGKHYFEYILDVCSANGAGIYLGVTHNPSNSDYTRDITAGMGGGKYNLSGGALNGGVGDAIGVMLDFKNLKVEFFVNGSSVGVTGTLLKNCEYTPVVHMYYKGDQISLKFPPKPEFM
jgi:hypothetical protein